MDIFVGIDAGTTGATVGSAEKVTKAQIIFTSPKAKRKIHWESDSWWNGDSRIVQKSYSIAVTCDTKVQGF